MDEDVVKEYADSKRLKFKLVSVKKDPKSFNGFLEELVDDGKNFLEKSHRENNFKKKNNAVNIYYY